MSTQATPGTGETPELPSLAQIIQRFGEDAVNIAISRKGLDRNDLSCPLEELIARDLAAWLKVNGIRGSAQQHEQQQQQRSTSRPSNAPVAPHPPPSRNRSPQTRTSPNAGGGGESDHSGGGDSPLRPRSAVGGSRASSSVGYRSSVAAPKRRLLLSHETIEATIRNRREKMRCHELLSLQRFLEEGEESMAVSGGSRRPATAATTTEGLLNHHKEVVKRMRERFTDTIKQTVKDAQRAVQIHDEEMKAWRETNERLKREREERERERAAAIAEWAAETKRRNDERVREEKENERRKEEERREIARLAETVDACQRQKCEESAQRKAVALAKSMEVASRLVRHAFHIHDSHLEKQDQRRNELAEKLRAEEDLRVARQEQEAERHAASVREKAEQRDQLRRRRFEIAMQQRQAYAARAADQLAKEESRGREWEASFGDFLLQEQRKREQRDEDWHHSVQRAHTLQQEFEEETSALCQAKEMAAAQALANRDALREQKRLEQHMTSVEMQRRVDQAKRARLDYQERTRRKAAVKAQASEERSKLMTLMSNEVRAEKQRLAAMASLARMRAQQGKTIDLAVFEKASAARV